MTDFVKPDAVLGFSFILFVVRIKWHVVKMKAFQCFYLFVCYHQFISGIFNDNWAEISVHNKKLSIYLLTFWFSIPIRHLAKTLTFTIFIFAQSLNI